MLKGHGSFSVQYETSTESPCFRVAPYLSLCFVYCYGPQILCVASSPETKPPVFGLRWVGNTKDLFLSFKGMQSGQDWTHTSTLSSEVPYYFQVLTFRVTQNK